MTALLTDAIARHQVAGASVALYRNGSLTEAVAGAANLSTGVELTPDTLMQIGSVTKIINATLIMQLVDEGLISLSDPISKHLPGFRLQDPSAAAKITVQMLINHTSGIDGDITADHGHDEETIEKTIARMSTTRLLFEPGTDCSYSNAAIVVAGHIAEKVTGRSWYDLVKSRIFKPLGLPHSAVLPEDAMLFRTSVGHFFDPATGELTRSSHVFLPLGYAPAGPTTMMSAADLVTFARAHLADGLAPNGARLLSSESARLMRVITEPRIGMATHGVGLGWMTFGNDVCGHGGGGPGIVAKLYISPSHQLALAVLTNSDNGRKVIDELASTVLKNSCGPDIGEPQRELSPPVSQTDLFGYAGRYEDSWMIYNVAKEADALTLSTRTKIACYDCISTDPTDAAPLRPLGDDLFALTPTEKQRTANRDFFPEKGDVFVAFRNRGQDGHFRNLANGIRLYGRTG
ncbi:serine hydrolase domain-containing protein [Rhizobium calliandrae]|uniref:Serine hydrolase domain-containing protein n=1 Tax=Rhizobium calliandrae TaxID=1312182 RepID=A0ABT7KNV9_9HYPH|nr:serine hydrolase domain-containing protein [Rhizobium calliandrae]MDL2410320.1 serine hydrolase domain-containing protein [Rhizobium calliandrae]